jgi:dipeptidase
VQRHGPANGSSGADQEPADHAFLIADPGEAFTLETSGKFWVYQEVGKVRAAGDVSLIRQDWDRIAPGLAGQAIDRGWWPEDGSKLDFAGSLAADPRPVPAPFHRWGRATLFLEEQSGQIDVPALRRLLSDHDENPAEPGGEYTDGLCRHDNADSGSATLASFVVSLSADPNRLTMLWCAFGPPCTTVYFPVFFQGDLPALLTRGLGPSASDCLPWRVQQLSSLCRRNREFRDLARGQLTRLQAHFDQEAEEFLAVGSALLARGDLANLARQAGFFMQHTLEQFEKTMDQLEGDGLGLATATNAVSSYHLE